MFHPSSLLLAWGCLLLVWQRLPFDWLLPASLLLAVAVCLLATELYLSMLRRTRWLFLTLFVLFSTMTPGVFLASPWSLGIVTEEGLIAAFEHMLRLAAMLGLVALLLDRLDQRAIVSALFLLLRPLAICGVDCERVSVRLLLVLDHLAADKVNWRHLLHMSAPEPSRASVVLPITPFQVRDFVLGGFAVFMMLLGLLWW